MTGPLHAVMLATLAIITVSATPVGSAQIVVPATPKKFVTRPIIGGTSTGAVTVEPPTTPPLTRYITYFVLADARAWTNLEGKEILGKLIAFEDLESKVPAGTAQLPTPTPLPHPTVVRDGKVRLLVNNKTSVVALNSLSQPDREFIEKVRAARAK